MVVLGHSPLIVPLWNIGIFFIRDIDEETTYSATESAFIPVAGWTWIFLFLQYSVSILSKPTPNLPINFNLNAFFKISKFTWVLFLTIRPS